jgi:hypothetical protein
MNSADIFESMKTLVSEIIITSEEVTVSESFNPEDPKFILDQKSRRSSPFGNLKKPSYLVVANEGEEWVMKPVFFNGFLLVDFSERYQEIDKEFEEAINREAEFAKIGIRTKSVLPDYVDLIKERYLGVRFDSENSKYNCDFAKVQINVPDHFTEDHICSFYHVLSHLLEDSLSRLAKNSLPRITSILKWNLKAVELIELIASLNEKHAITGKDRVISDIEIFRQFETFLNIDLGDIYKQLNSARGRKKEKAAFLVKLAEAFRSIKDDDIKKKYST